MKITSKVLTEKQGNEAMLTGYSVFVLSNKAKVPLAERGIFIKTPDSLFARLEHVLSTGGVFMLALCISIMLVGCATPGNSLRQAAAAGNIVKVKALVSKGTDVNKPSGPPGTSLIVAVRNGRTEVARYLVEHGANVNADVPSTPLYFAAARADNELVEFLLAKGAHVNARDGDGDTPLYGAVRGGPSVVSTLIHTGADVNVVDKAGWSPLNLAAMEAKGLQLTETERLLLNAGARTNVLSNEPAVSGKTIGVFATYLKQAGRTNDATRAYLVAKDYLEKGVRVTEKRMAAASRKAYWASMFEPQPQLYGSSYQQGAIEQTWSSTLETAIFAGHNSSDYHAQESSLGSEEFDLKVCISECNNNLGLHN